MKNITVSVDDEVHRLARVKAAQLETSISALVGQFLTALVKEEDEFTRLLVDEQALRQRIESFRGADRLPREKLHDRRR